MTLCGSVCGIQQADSICRMCLGWLLVCSCYDLWHTYHPFHNRCYTTNFKEAGEYTFWKWHILAMNTLKKSLQDFNWATGIKSRSDCFRRMLQLFITRLAQVGETCWRLSNAQGGLKESTGNNGNINIYIHTYINEFITCNTVKQSLNQRHVIWSCSSILHAMTDNLSTTKLTEDCWQLLLFPV